MSPSYLEKVTATFRPRRTDNLTEDAAPHVGEVHEWQFVGLVEDGPYVDQDMWLCLSSPLIGWAPGEDIAIREPDTRPACFRCACPASMHDHFRSAKDCGHCGRSICREYRSRPSLAAYWWAIKAAVRLLATPRR